MGDEIGRRDQPLDRMLPAQQRLEARHAAIRQPDDGLVEDIQLVGGQRMAQFAFQRHAVAGRQVFQLGGIDPGAGAALLLGADQRQLGILDQGRTDPRSARRVARPMLQGAKTSRVVDRVGPRAGFRQRIADGLGRAARIGEQEGKAVAADAEDLRRLAQPGQPLAPAAAGCGRRRHRPGWHGWP